MNGKTAHTQVCRFSIQEKLLKCEVDSLPGHNVPGDEDRIEEGAQVQRRDLLERHYSAAVIDLAVVIVQLNPGILLPSAAGINYNQIVLVLVFSSSSSMIGAMTDFMTPAQQTTLLVLLALVLLLTVMVRLIRALRRRAGRAALLQAQVTNNAPPADLPGPWRALRDEVEMTNRVLTRPVFDRVCQIFLDYYAAGDPLTPSALTREYDTREEFLLVVDEHGQPSRPKREMLESFHKTASARPEFRRWFREAQVQEGQWAGVPVLLAARWLCHLTGLRHGTVEVFIDLPNLEGHTLVQVRGLDKFEAPGAFDIACAGHIDGVDGPEDSLGKELREELNLELDQLEALRLIGRYNSYTNEHNADWQSALKINNEHRVLYRARLKPEAAASIRFSDGEVAGLAVFSVAELRALMQAYPERVASGLSDALGFYQSPDPSHSQ